MVDFSDISLAFDDIIDTPAKRRRQVDAASQQIRGRYDQSGHPFALLAGGIAGSIPGITENVRRAGRDMGVRAFQTPGEAMGQQLQGLNPNNPQDRDAILRTVSQSNPAGAAQLESVWREQDMALRASQNRFPVDTERYSDGTTWTQTSNGGVIVKGADGVLITGTEEISAAIAAGRQSDIDDAGAMAAARAEGERSIAQLALTSDAVNMALSQARQNDDFIRLIEEEGASGTLWSKYTPEFLRDNATIEFNQLARQAGLDVIASVTFGALSKAELELAMDTAVPRFTTNEAALNYFRRRKEAQLALAAELSGYLNFQRANPGKYANKYEYEQEWKETRQEIFDDRAEQRAAANAALRGQEAAVTENSDPTGANDTAYQEFLRQNGGSPNGR
jgi:hypothetical protein|tara:strand:+ start:2265 stop:3440 length:1176 start_codon:yes stop_codon:yes gene_type:complete